MKKLYIVLFALVLGISFNSNAQTFSAVNSDGDTIYYYITSNNTYKVSVTFKGNTVFSYTDEYTGDITIPSSVQFNNNIYSVTAIAINAFYDNSNITSINLPSTITSIGAYSFRDCSGLTSITIPENVTQILSNAFLNCTGLTSINIPSSVNNIAMSSFSNCTNVDTIIMNRVIPPTCASNAFQNIPNTVTVILPCSSYIRYRSAACFNNFTNLQELDTCFYTINVESCDTTLGTVTGSGTYTYDTITITATPLNNYEFISWQDGDTNSIRTIIVSKDSTFTATFKEVVYNIIIDTNCQNHSYFFYGNYLETAGTYYRTYSLSPTKDSVIVLHLSFNPTYSIDIYDTICDGETYTQNGFNTNTSGLNILFLQTTKGCDSLINLYLTINPTKTFNFNDTTCQGRTYTLYGFNVDTAGLHTLNLQTYKGCDSTVNLTLFMHPSYSADIYGEVCEGKFYYQNGFFEHMPGIHTRYLQTTKGCDSLINLHLTVIQTPAPTNLTLNNIANYIELNWEGEQENYVIYRDNDSLAMTTTITYQDSNVVEGVNYCYKIKAINENCESVFSNEECKTFLDINTIETNNFNVYLYPNPTSNKTILRVEGLKENALVRIYDITGRLIQTLEINTDQKELEIDVENFAKGVYNIRITNSTTNITKKLVVNR
ncbi:MAG: leucine-rich repeat protein [Bacteroidetes bacterium]|nr:leucine-rich repeat protein [Bacteroidota bacterium]